MKRQILFLLTLLTMLVVRTTSAWGQTTDYSGTYYIGSRDYTTPIPSPNTNFYLCPTEGWAFYVATNNVTGTNNGQPFLTTYKCKDGVYDARKAVWTLAKHPTEADCYYIIQTLTGKYVVSNGTLTGAGSTRARVHLESVADDAALAELGDKALFEITYDNGHYDIMPHSTYGRDGTNIYLVVNNNNKNQLDGESSRTNGPTGFKNCGGIIGLYTHPDNGNAYFYLEPATIDPPTITNNNNGTFTITAADGAAIYYTIDGTTPTTSTTASDTSGTGTTSVTVTVDQNSEVQQIKAIAKSSDDYFPTIVKTYTLPVCERPVITVENNIVSFSAPTGASVYYTLNDTEATPTSGTLYDNNPFQLGSATAVRAIATMPGYYRSQEAFNYPPLTVHSSTDISDMNRSYILASDFASSSSIGTSGAPFKGTIDGNMVTLSELGHPLVAYADGATIKNVILKDVNITTGTNVGAICGEATGASRIYNCGVLGTVTETENEDTKEITVTGTSTISGSNYVGSIVGLLDGTSRVINCYSYAVITGGTRIGGIVGYNNVSTNTPANATTGQKTMVMNCMFYGDITNGSTTGTRNAPIYNGYNITNVGNGAGVGNYNYFRAEARYVQDKKINVYNCALAAEERFLNRFEFFRHLLNSNRALAAWWATGSAGNKDEMMKWELETADRSISTPYPYPVLKPAKDGDDYIQYPSVVNVDADHAPAIDAKNEHYNEGCNLGSFTIKIKGVGGGAVYEAPTDAKILKADGTPITDGSKREISVVITDKDPERFNFNYYKVQLPYYNDYGTKNYMGNRVVTGWKIVEVSDGGTGTFTTTTGDTPADATANDKGEITETPYNFADRNCSKKDLYSVSGRVFNQGAYYDVPEGVTSITIEPYWGKAVYVSDPYLDKVYDQGMSNGYDVTTIGGGLRYENGVSVFNDDNNQKVYTTIADAVAEVSTSGDVYDNAIVLVGNTHNSAISLENNSKSFTLMSVDMDHDNEPDYSYILRFNERKAVHPVRIDFLNVIGLGMAQKSTGGQGTYNIGIMQPKGWFEVTNTGLFRVTQLEYDSGTRTLSPVILHGGVIEQWVTCQSGGHANKVKYYHVGGNVWFKEFHIGAHQDKTGNDDYTPHPPISVTGGDYDNFYLTGYYNTPKNNYDDNAECYIDGGRFGRVCGTGMQGIGNKGTHANGNIIWQINHADIDEFYAGGLNAAHIAEGNITTVISNSRVDLFCGGPKFGDMNEGKTVFTTATNCTFNAFFGAGYGGNSYNRRYPDNKYDLYNYDWDSWVNTEYTNEYNATYKGVDTRIDYQFIPRSNNTQNVARLFVDYVSFSLATTHEVTSSLTNCTITKSKLGRGGAYKQCKGNFYGGGSLGKVDGPVTSTLTDCTVEGSVFGAGYSASTPTVSVMKKTGDNWFLTAPSYDTNLGAYLEAELPATENYTWEYVSSVTADNAIDKEGKKLRTTVDLSNTNLGSVSGDVTLTIKGGSKIGTIDEETKLPVDSTGYVYGGGDQSSVGGHVNMTIEDNTKVYGGVYGGGNLGSVGTYTVADETYHTSHADVPVGKPYECTAGGKTTVVITGNAEVGPDNMKMITDSGYPDDYGHVFAAGKGHANPYYDNMAYVNETDLTISGNAFIKGSVYGGSENGHVLHNTNVLISGGQIGNPDGENRRYTADDWKEESLKECAHWVFSGNHDPWDYYDYQKNSTKPKPATDGHTFYGNVFGGGSGYYPYAQNTTEGLAALKNKSEDYADGLWNPKAGVVEGNTTVTITGGHILTSVYGGNECTDVVGSCTVNMSGGTVGVPRTTDEIKAHPVTCYVFGAGKGDQRINFNQWTNVASTQVTISGGRIYGSVFGGGEDGHVIGDAETNISQAEGKETLIGSTGTSGADGNIFGGGRGFSETALTAGAVCGNVSINISGGTMLGTVFGGGRLASVGPYIITAENEEKYGKLIPDGKVQVLGSVDPNNASNPDDDDDANARHGEITINISGGTIGSTATSTSSIGDVFGGCKGTLNNNLFGLAKRTKVTVSGDATRIYGTVYGGGEAGNVAEGVEVNINGGTIDGSVYGGGALASTNIECKDEIDKTGKSTEVNLHGGTIAGNVFGGGLGRKQIGTEGDEDYVSPIAAIVGGDVTVKLNENNGENGKNNTDNCIVKGKIFGCNNLNGTPRGNVTVHVYKTQGWEENDVTDLKDTDTRNNSAYELTAVYGGGNEAAYLPTDAYSFDENTSTYTYVSDNDEGADCQSKTNVIIEGCSLTSIKEVYGGGNSAPTPATSVTVKSCYEIGTVFGGGNGADRVDDGTPEGSPNLGANVGYSNYSYNDEGLVKDYDGVYGGYPSALTKDDRRNNYKYGTGRAETRLYGGTVHNAFGGSNTLGNVCSVAFSALDQQDACDLNVGEIYGAGNRAKMDAEIKVELGCIAGLDKLFGGALEADVDNDVVLDVTSGTYGSVYGGNNKGGHISGTITVNINETGCHPIIIGKLYGGGMEADYSAPSATETHPYSPLVNIVSATQIGTVYGGGCNAEVEGNPCVKINMEQGQLSGKTEKEPLGTVGTVFGGGYSGNVIGNTRIEIGTDDTKEAHITGSVYGGGENGHVYGKTEVIIGKE